MGLHTAPVFEKYFLDLYPNTVYLRTTAYLFEIDESIEKNARFFFLNLSWLLSFQNVSISKKMLKSQIKNFFSYFLSILIQ